MTSSLDQSKIAVIGLGYVGLPLAIEFAKKYNVLGFDINNLRVEELKEGKDHTQEAIIAHLNSVRADSKDVNSETGLSFSNNKEELRSYNTFIVTVPTPIDQFNSPDLRPFIKASEMLGRILKSGDIVIYASTVYPGCTEEDCVAVLEK